MAEDGKDGHQHDEEAMHIEHPGLVLGSMQDPNDPLMWTRSQKTLKCLTVCFFTVLSTFNSSNLVVAVVRISDDFHQSPTRTGYAVCFNLLFMGLGNLLWVPLSRVIGKRPVYLSALLLFTACNIWTYEASTYESLLVSRIISGLAAAAADATIPSLIADLFLIHERGHYMMIFHFALSTGFFVGPLICAYVTQEAGWRWTSGFLAIAGGVTFVVGFFTIRKKRTIGGRLPIRRSFTSWLSLKHGFNREVSFLRTVWRTIRLALHPPHTMGWIFSWDLCWMYWVIWFYIFSHRRNIVVQMTASQVFAESPYRWDVGNLGLLALAGFIGAVIAFVVGGKLIDVLSAYMTEANGGIREPEFRLPALIIPAIVGPMGVLLFGISSEVGGTSPPSLPPVLPPPPLPLSFPPWSLSNLGSVTGLRPY
ncbi:major facilitator superfamily domain-containing protein [Aspergillus germanicus]